MEEFLTATRLEQYARAFEQQGFDDVDFLADSISQSEEDMRLLVEATGLKPGHVLKLRQALERYRFQRERSRSKPATAAATLTDATVAFPVPSASSLAPSGLSPLLTTPYSVSLSAPDRAVSLFRASGAAAVGASSGSLVPPAPFPGSASGIWSPTLSPPLAPFNVASVSAPPLTSETAPKRPPSDGPSRNSTPLFREGTF